VERAVSLEEAEEKALQAIQGLGFRPVLENHSDSTNGPTAWSCSLTDANGKEKPHGLGFGKGNSEEARVGALFEALEHLLDGPDYLDTKKVVLRSIDSFTSGELAAEASVGILANATEVKLAAHPYAALTPGDPIDVPLYMSSPWYVEDPSRALRASLSDNFDYREVARYSTNSGWAIGITEHEAMVHGLNEVIERDALSMLLARSFLGEGEPPFLVNPSSLSNKISTLLSTVEHLLETRVYLIDIKTDVDVPAYLAYTLPNSEKPPLQGSGASLSPEYAVYRALSELVQDHLLRDTESLTKDPFAYLEPLRKYPSLYKCGFFDLSDLLKQSQMIPFETRANPIGPDAHLTELTKKVTTAGFSIYHGRKQVLNNGITAIHVLVPGMEHFMAITKGLVITPGKRAIKALCTPTHS